MRGRRPKVPHGEHGATLVELIVSTAAASMILAALIAASVSIQRSISATDQFIVNATGQSRMVDYITQDLRRAVRVGTLVGGVKTPFRTQQNFSVSETNILTIDVPDYYASNTPDNAAGSAYKSARYPRSVLNTLAAFNSQANPTLNGVVPWTEAATMVNRRQLTRFAPAGSGDGTIQVRYFQATRGTSPPVTCFYRAEYPSGSNTASEVREIADSVSRSTANVMVTVSGLNGGNGFRIESKFTPRSRVAGTPAGAASARVEVSLRNPRRD